MLRILLQVAVVALLVAACAADKNDTKWVTHVPHADFITTSTVVVGDVYALTTGSSLFALNASSGSVLWQYSRPEYMSLNTAPLAGRAGASFTEIAYPNINGSACYVDAIDVSTGFMMWRSTLLPLFSGLQVTDDVAVVTAFPVGNASTQNITGFNSQNGARLWSIPEWTLITTHSGTVYGGVLVIVTVNLIPIGSNVFSVRSFDATSGKPWWSFACTSFLAESTPGGTGSGLTRVGRNGESRVAGGAPWGGLIAVLNYTRMVSALNFSASIVFISRGLGIRVGAVELPHSHTAMFGTFINGESRFVYTDGLTVVSCIDVATKAYLWNTSLWTDPAFRPFADAVTQVTQAGDQVLLTFTQSSSSVNVASPVSMTAFDLKTGALQGSVAFPTNNQALVPLLDRRLLVLPSFSSGFSVYSLVTGELLTTNTEWTIVPGSVQVVQPGVIIFIDQEHQNVRRLAL